MCSVGDGVVWVLHSSGRGRGYQVGGGGFAVGGWPAAMPCIVVGSVVSGL